MSSGHPGVATGVADNTGACGPRIGPPPTGLKWIVRQIAVESDKPNAIFNVQCVLTGLPLTTPTAIFTGSAASGDPPISIESHDYIDVIVTSSIVGANITVAYYYDEVPA